MAAALSARFRFPICRSAQFTALRTKFRGSPDSLTMTGKKATSVSSVASRSCTASAAISTNPARLTNSSSRSLQANALS